MKQYSFLSEAVNFATDYENIVHLVYNTNKNNIANNCQKFAIAFELACRGIKYTFNKTLTPLDRIFDTQYGFKYGYDNYNVFLTKENMKELHRIKSSNELYEKLLKENNNTRFLLKFDFGRSGHILNCVKQNDDVYLCDSMGNNYGKFKDTITKYPKIQNGFYFRIDNKNYDKMLLNDLKDTTTKIYSFNDNKQRFSSCLEFLHKNGKENTIFDVYRNDKKYGKIKCLNISKIYADKHKIWFKVWKFDWL